MEPKNKFFNDIKFVSTLGVWGIIIVSICLAIFLIIQSVNSLEQNEKYPGSTITLSGEGEVVAIPDIATFNYTIKETSEDVASAQSLVTKKNNKIIEILKESGIEEKDIKTVNYNIYPKYEWRSEPCPVGTLESYCPGGRNVIIGQEVTQSTKIKIREVEKAGEILAKIGKEEPSNVSGLSFTIDEDDSLKEEARGLAIKDAKEKANKLAEQLGVEIEGIANFREEERNVFGMGGIEKAYDSASGGEFSEKPMIPTGENNIMSRVYITFEID